MENKVKLKGMSGNYAGKEYFPEYDEFTIGRHFDCDLVLKEETVSSHHARIIKSEGKYFLEDLKSSNGTHVKGEKIDKKELRTGDIFSIDKIEFKFINPEEVERTVISDGIKISQPEETVIRERPEGLAHEREKPDTKPVMVEEAMKQVREIEKKNGSEKKSTKRSSRILPALITTLLFNYIAAIVLSILRYRGFSMNYIWSYIKPVLIGFPFIHTHLFWTMPKNLDGLMILIGICIPVGLILGGFIKQKTSAGNRLKNAFQLSIIYVFSVLIIQLAAMGVDVENWLELISRNNLGIDNFALSAGGTILYFFIFSMLFSFFGTLFSKNR